jgi:hypothetical protein
MMQKLLLKELKSTGMFKSVDLIEGGQLFISFVLV